MQAELTAWCAGSNFETSLENLRTKRSACLPSKQRKNNDFRFFKISFVGGCSNRLACWWQSKLSNWLIDLRLEDQTLDASRAEFQALRRRASVLTF
jgi:hypothetical protein